MDTRKRINPNFDLINFTRKRAVKEETQTSLETTVPAPYTFPVEKYGVYDSINTSQVVQVHPGVRNLPAFKDFRYACVLCSYNL